MIVINPYRFGTSYTAEYQAVLDKATALGYTLPSDANKVKQNALVVALKAAGIWTHLDALRVYKYSNNLNFAAIDWINPTKLSTNVNSPGFNDVSGLAPNGSTSYVNTNFIPSSNYINASLNNTSHFGYFGVSLSNTGSFWGTSTPAGALSFFMTSQIFGPTNDAFSAPGIGQSFNTGLTLIQRILSTKYNVIQNGVTLTASNSIASSGVPTKEIYIGAINNNGVAANFTSSPIALWGIGDGLAGLESALKTACDNFYAS